MVGRHFRAAAAVSCRCGSARASSAKPVEFTTDDGLQLRGSYLRGRTDEQSGVIVYCHEYLSDRWSYQPYLDHLRDLGFDIFTFDFRNHGESESEPGYEPDAVDVRPRGPRPAGRARYAAVAARSRSGGLRALRRQPRRNDGADRGAVEADVWGVVTDGAFPTHGTMVAYMRRWAEIYVPNRVRPEV